LREPDRAVQHDHGRDDDRIDRPAGVALEAPCEQRDHDRHQQQVDQRILELRRQPPPSRARRRLPQHVRAVGREPARGLGGSQAGVEVRAEGLRDGLGVVDRWVIESAGCCMWRLLHPNSA
jgi:hypothetical protein